MTTATPLAPTTPRLTLIQIEDAVEFFINRLTAGSGDKFAHNLHALLLRHQPRELIVGYQRPQGILLDALQAAGIDHTKHHVLGGPCRLTFDYDGKSYTTDEDVDDLAGKADGQLQATVEADLADFVKRGMDAQKAVDEAIKKALAGTSIIPDPAQLARALQLAEQVKQLERECDDRQAELNQRRERLLVLRREAAAAFTDPLQQPASTDGTGTTPPPLVSEATPAPVQAAPTEPPPASAESPAPEPGELYELKELAGLSDELLEHGLAKPPRHLFPQDESRAPTVPGEGGQVGRVIGYGGQYWAVVMCRMQTHAKTFTLNPVLSLTDWQGAIGDPGTMPDTWERRRQDNDDVAPEDVPLEDMLVTDENGMKWVFGPDDRQWQVLVPIEQKSPPPPPPPASGPSGVEKAMELLQPGTFIKTNYSGPFRVIDAKTYHGTVSLTLVDVDAKPTKKGGWADRDRRWINEIRLKDGKFSMNNGDSLEIISEQEALKLHDAGGVQEAFEKAFEEEQPAPAPPKKKKAPAAKPSLLEAAARSQLKSPEQPAGQSMKWGPWKGSLLSALHKFNVDVGDVLPTGEALQMYLAGMKPSAAAQSYVHSLGKAGKALDKIEHTTSSITGKNGSAKKGGSSGRRR